ncbi:p-aminobenzoyl-glutamate transport protein [Fusobacterium sp. DD29]|uniref:AbgT family transporter n=1 Tax=unclassified Fusobacterium TaxID=2648384 RepID=UPI001B8AE2CF|nr:MULTISPECIES: AbgT family transporter [unclassified Fusobacterium]MBR8702155.1 p-aminobenzoyl-glutamate transport protein [Fusobacterium sp. DD45]MBR8711978.1 p-aminobenzoyl-glutamate transport protein [Fusobacterium sp. DD28]MBR8750440.1 p-aminobenzoyl-glutamate transport protein [Fusobacterium sp. DD29]MBR8752551.1 p-aminobenzoyl-glutamate transport protein [Fusobacterium sp. DD26]MBR8762687.1 p-aminobenzoyl-glutamate transport protein [Fusobacterium sp. DD25]
MFKKKEKDAQEIGGFLRWVEKVGNSLPHPAMLFFILALIVIVVSHFVASTGASVTYFDAKAKAEVTKKAVSLLNKEGLAYMFNTATNNYTGFAPLGTVLVAMLGVGVAEWTGLFNTSLKKLLINANPKYLTPIVIFAGIMSNIASDAGYLVVVPIGALVFAMAGRHPLAGMAAAFAGVSGGFSANLVLGTTDPLLTGITNQALIAAGIDISLAPTCNWYFLGASTIFLTIIGTFVTDKIVEKNLGKYTGSYQPNNDPVTELESKGLRNATIALLIYCAVMAFLMFPQNAIFRDSAHTLKTFLHGGLIPGILLLFLVPGYVYGKTVGTIKTSHDLVEAMTSAMKSMGGYLVLTFFAAQFIAYFGKTNLGTIISFKGADALEAAGLTGLPLIILFIFLSAFLNLFMGSASAKWAIMAPIFVPMMYRLGLSPALTQVAYRIGDSSTNIITPLMSYFAIIVILMQKYEKKSGLGTLMSLMLPYSISFLIFWTILMAIWILLGIPVGPEAPLFI